MNPTNTLLLIDDHWTQICQKTDIHGFSSPSIKKTMLIHIRLLIVISAFLCISSSTLLSQSDRYLHFDGNDDYAILPNASQYFTGATGVSMTGWFCAENPGYGRGYMGFRDPGASANEMYVIEIGGGMLECRYITAGGGLQEYVSPAGTVQGNNWQHVAWVADGAATTLYINGQPAGSTTSNGTFTGSSTDFTIGKSLTTCCNFVFSGRVDEVSVWSKGLTQAEIQDMMENELAGNEANLELYYKMDQGIPAGDNTAITELVSEVGGGTRDADLLNFSLNGVTSNFNESSFDPSFTVSDFCAGQANQAVLTGTPGGTYSLQPDPMDGSTIDPLTGEITAGVTGTTYTIRYTTMGPCAIHESHDVTVLSADAADFMVFDYCIGQAEPAMIDGTAGGTFSFEPPVVDGATIDPLTGEIYDGVAGTTYMVQYATSGNCPDSQIQAVNVMDAPSIVDLTENCAADELTYVVTFDISGGDPSSYTVIGAGTLTGSTFVSDPIASGSPYDFGLSDSNSCGVDDASGTVICACPAQASFSPDFSICPDGIGQIEITLEGNGPWILDYMIDGLPQAPIMPSASPYIMLISGAGTYTFTSVSDVDCTSALSMDNVVEVGLLNVPTASISGMEEVCSGEEALFPIELTGTGPWDISYAIDGIIQSVVNFTDASSVLSADQTGEYTIVFVTDQTCSGEGTGSAQVIVHELPEATVGGTIYFCEGSSVVWPIDVSGSPDIVLEYSLDGVLQVPLSIDQEGVFESEVSQTGLYELVTISDANCIGTVLGTTMVESHPLPTAMIDNGQFIICEGSAQAIDVQLTGTANWTVDYTIDGVLQPTLSTSIDPLTIQADQSGVYELVEVTDNFCTDPTGTETVEIEFFPPIEVTVSEDVGSCAGDTAAVSVIAQGGQEGPYTYVWNSVDLVEDNGPSATFDPQSDAIVTLTINDGCAIDYDFDIPLTVHPLPTLSIQGPQAVCSPGVVELTNGSSAQFSGGQCQWIVEGDTIGQCGSLEYFFDIGTYDVEVNVTSAHGCYNELLIEDYIEIFPGLSAGFDFSPATVTTLSPEVDFTDQSVGEDIDHFWTFGDLPASSEVDPTILFPSENGGGIYPVCLYVTNDFGCIDSTCTMIEVENELLILAPNSFTPNGDGLNDLFSPSIIGALDGDYLFTIYDRYGRLVFESMDKEEKWNGDHTSNDRFYSADGLYNWEVIVEVEGTTDRRSFTGSVFLIR